MLLTKSIKHSLNIVALLVIIILASQTLLADNGENEAGISLETVFAEYNGGVITKADFDEEFDKIPPMYRSRFSTLEGKEHLLNSMVLNAIVMEKAYQIGIDEAPQTQQALAETLNRFFAREFMRRDVTGRVEIAESDIKEYYENFPNRFKIRPNTTINYLKVAEEDTAQEVTDAFDRGVDFIDIMNQYSINHYSKRNQGIITNIRGRGYIQGVGRDEELDNAIKEAPLNEWTGPLKTDIGYHFFKVTERIPERIKPLEEVRSEIVSRIKPIYEAELREEKFNLLKDKYDVQIDQELLATLNFVNITPQHDSYDDMAVNSSEPALQLAVSDLLREFNQLNHQEKAQMNNPDHLLRWIDGLVETHLFAHEARNKGYEEYVMENTDVQQTYQTTIQRQLFQKLVIDAVTASDEEVEEYYSQNIADFTKEAHRTIQLFLFEGRRDARRAHRAVSRALANDNEEAIMEVIDNSLYAEDNGIISNITRDPDIPIFDEEDEIDSIVWDTEVGELSSIKRNSEGNRYFLLVQEESPEIITPLEDVYQQINDQLSLAGRQQRWQQVQDELKEEFNVVAYTDKLAGSQTARELFDLAENALQRKRYNEALEYYDRIIANFNNNRDDYNALFMKAFLLTEELGKDEEAIEIFEQLIDEYPYDDLHESAEFMIKSLRDGYSLFDD